VQYLGERGSVDHPDPHKWPPVIRDRSKTEAAGCRDRAETKTD